MKYKLSILLLLFSLNLTASENEKMFRKSAAKWNRSNIKEYFVKVEYSAFSPVAGIWELNVKDGKICKCTYNGKPADNHQTTAEMFTMENLYKTAWESFPSGKDDPFIIRITYGKKGFIKSLSKTRNPEYKAKVKTDTSFKIEVLELKTEER